MNEQIFTQVRRPGKVYEKVDNSTKTEKAGYIPARIQIEQFLQAGKRLANWRKEQYDFSNDEEVDLSVEVPVRDSGIDLAEVAELKAQVEYNLGEQAKAAAISAAEAVKKADIEPTGAQG